MPKSKRSRVVSLTQTDKKGREGKEQLYTQAKECVEKYQYAWVFSVENMRNTYLKQVRSEWKDSRILFGRTKVMAKALGTTPEDEAADGLFKLTKYLTGNVGILFTDHPADVVKDWFESYVKTDFARAGVVATRDFVVPAGQIYSRGGDIPAEDDVAMANTLEPTLRQLGMPTRLKNGIVTLDNEYQVCKEGETLSGHQTRLLKMFGVAMADFKVKLVAYWSKTGEVTEVEE
ncbi:mRNA turnover and ribosome assembly protein [Saitoella coloradoensis]